MANRTATGSELLAAVRGLSAARDLPPGVILDALRAALASAYHKLPDAHESHVTVQIDEATGETRVLAHYTVVDAQFLEDPDGEMTLEEAREKQSDAVIGDTITIDVTPHDFGRIAAQNAKQVILQRIREAEREQTYSTYAEREGDIVYGTIQSTSRETVTVQLDRVEAHLPKGHQIPGEQYAPNQRLRVYVAEVKRAPKGPQVIVSRTHRDMLKRMMELEIPEIFQGIVEVKAIAREAGSRSKVAVWSHQSGVDPVGACVGMRGVRIQALVRELGGEKIDIVEWDPDPRLFIAHALSPARVRHVVLVEDAERRTANVIVPDDQLSLAIGREGQNARLAAKLTGWRIDIRAESESAELIEQLQAQEAQRASAVAVAAEQEAAREAATPTIKVGAPVAPVEPAREPAAAPAEIEAEVLQPAALATEAPAGEAPAGAPAGVPGEAAPAEAPEQAEAEPAQWKVPTLDDVIEEEDEASRTGRKKGKKGRGRGAAAADKGRKTGRRHVDWEDEAAQWSEKDAADLLEFTESDFLGSRDAEEDEEA